MVHVSVIDITPPSDIGGQTGMIEVAHMPFDQTALAASVDKLLGTGRPPAQAFQTGYDQWKTDPKAGVYSITVTDAISLMFETIRQGREGAQ